MIVSQSTAVRARLLPLLVASALFSGACRPASDPRPNIIVLLVDTLRTDYLGTYGFPGRISPNLDALAAESFVFENCFSQAPWTPPSIGTLFTSLDPQVHGLNRFLDHRFLDPESGTLRASVLPDTALTLAEALTVSGYHTAGIVANPWLREHSGLAQGFAFYDDRDASKRTPATVLTAAARAWLDGAPREPFFLYLHLMDVHEPYDAPREDFDELRPFLDGGGLELSDAQHPPEFLEIEVPWATAEERRQLSYWKTRYASGVRLLDRRLSGLLGQLRDSGLLDRSWIVVTSDHGEELFEHAGWGHGNNLYDHQLRVPLLIRPPGGLTAARRIEPAVRLIDLMPTILAIAGARRRPELQGTDLGPLMRGESAAALEVLSTGVVGRPEAYALRIGRYKLVVDRRAGVTELFDVGADPGETTDLSSRRPKLLAQMVERLDAHLAASIVRGRLEPQTTELPQAVEEDLRALGYLD